MEYIIIGAELIIGIILGVIAIGAACGIIGILFFALGTLCESITNFFEERKNKQLGQNKLKKHS